MRSCSNTGSHQTNRSAIDRHLVASTGVDWHLSRGCIRSHDTTTSTNNLEDDARIRSRAHPEAVLLCLVQVLSMPLRLFGHLCGPTRSVLPERTCDSLDKPETTTATRLFIRDGYPRAIDWVCGLQPPSTWAPAVCVCYTAWLCNRTTSHAADVSVKSKQVVDRSDSATRAGRSFMDLNDSS